MRSLILDLRVKREANPTKRLPGSCCVCGVAVYKATFTSKPYCRFLIIHADFHISVSRVFISETQLYWLMTDMIEASWPDDVALNNLYLLLRFFQVNGTKPHILMTTQRI